MLSNKIHPPRRRDDMLVRPRLLERLAAEAAPLVLVTGPAGSGKTVLVRQWLDHSDRPGAWLTIDPRDNDPARFWTYFAAAVATARPDFGWSPDGPVGVESMDRLVDALVALGPLLLVLDDLHFLVEGQVLAELGLVLETLPAEVRLILVSRVLPQLRLARRRALGELVEVRGQELLFTPQETEQALGRPGQDPVAAAVHDSTGGWAVAVGFAARLREPDAQRTAPRSATSRTRQQVADFLTEEVLRTQPEPVQRFLLDTSVLDEITVAAANAVRDSADGAAHLDHLQRNDVFLTPLDGSGVETWRHHALVRDHLRRTLERTQPESWTTLHLRAARFFEGADLERAVGHALAAPDPVLAAGLIEGRLDERGGLDLLVPSAQLLRWLEAIPDEVFTDRGALRSYGLGLAAGCGRIDLVDRWLAARPPGGVAGLEEVFAEAWRADVVGDMPRVRDACRRALALCEPGSTWWRTIHGGLAAPEYMLGNWEAAAESFDALRRSLVDASVRRARSDQENVRAFYAVVRARLGAPAAASEALEDLRAWVADAARLGYESEGIAAWAEAMSAFYAGDLATATRWDTLPDDSVFGEQPLSPLVLRLDLARVRRAAGDRVRAAELLGEVRDRLRAFADPGLFAAWAAEEEAALGIAEPSTAPAGPLAAPRWPAVEALSPREQEVLRLLRSEFSLPEIAAHLYVSYNTVKTHTRVIYRKLDVGGRSAAVARGRQLGYL